MPLVFTTQGAIESKKCAYFNSKFEFNEILDDDFLVLVELSCWALFDFIPYVLYFVG